MTKQLKNAIVQIINMIFIITGLVIVFSMNLSFYYLLAVLFGSLAISKIIDFLLPVEDKKKLKPSKKATTSTRKTYTAASNNKSQNKNLSEKDLLIADIDSLSGEDFERLVYLYFKDKGFKPETTPKSGDHGVDLVVTDPDDGFKIAVQCKRYEKSTAIGNGDLIKLEGGKRFYRCSGTLFITTSSYTKKAKEFAESCKMETWNRLHVFDKIDKWRKDKYKKTS